LFPNRGPTSASIIYGTWSCPSVAHRRCCREQLLRIPIWILLVNHARLHRDGSNGLGTTRQHAGCYLHMHVKSIRTVKDLKLWGRQNLVNLPLSLEITKQLILIMDIEQEESFNTRWINFSTLSKSKISWPRNHPPLWSKTTLKTYLDKIRWCQYRLFMVHPSNRWTLIN
jgi:hypothetical protein